MYIRALQGKEEALGPDHTSTLDTVNNLGVRSSSVHCSGMVHELRDDSQTLSSYSCSD